MKPYLFISGAAGCLGQALALECAARGYDLFLTDLSENEAGFFNDLRERFQVQVQYKACDLTSSEQRSALYQSILDKKMSFSGLINVAGIDFEGAFLERAREEMLKILRLNIEATLDTTGFILKLRDPDSTFRVINICSLAAYYPMPYKAVYAASKRFLLDFSLALGEEIRPWGTVTAVCPAGMPTTPENIRAILRQGLMGFLTTLETRDVARQTLEAALRGKSVLIPGRFNQVINLVSRLAPARAVLRLIAYRWKKPDNPTGLDNSYALSDGFSGLKPLDYQ